eukprot:NODE_43_length_28809_cov_0.237200.p16 type:complete len:167 gc:universal NODE_43_length_28809_cov_0.237200:11817-11317(-)
MDRTLPIMGFSESFWEQKRMFPFFKVPDNGIKVATAPTPFLILDSTTRASNDFFSSLSSSSSANAIMFSSKSCMFVPFKALISTHGTSPPKSSSSIPLSTSCLLTLAILQPCLSTLFKATIKGRFEFLICSSAFLDCSLNPSSAAITRIPISAPLAPRLLISSKAE